MWFPQHPRRKLAQRKPIVSILNTDFHSGPGAVRLQVYY